jgi:EthD domain
MAAQAFKMLIFLKRRPGMSVQAFRDYYENSHSKLCMKYMAGARRYIRKYVDPVPADEELGFDVITELWYDDRAMCEAVAKFCARGELPPDVIADEEKLFDRSKTRYATVVEHESDLSLKT